MIKMPQHVLAFAKDNLDIYKTFSDYFNHYRADTYGAKVSYSSVDSEGKPINFEDKTEIMNRELKAEVARVSCMQNLEFSDAVLNSNPMYRWATFAVINALIDMVIPDVLMSDIGMFTEIKVGGYGDSFTYTVKPNDLFYISKASHGKRTGSAQRQYEGQVAIVPEERDVTVTEDLYRILCGNVNLAEFAMKAALSMEAEMALDAYTAFNGIFADASFPAALKITGFTTTSVLTLAGKVKSFNSGAKPVFVGTQVALNKVFPTAATTQVQIDSEYVKIGYLKVFGGYECLVLDQKADWQSATYATLIDDTKIYVMCPSMGKPVKTCIEGQTITVSDGVNANANREQVTTLSKMWGTGVATNSKIGLITLA